MPQGTAEAGKAKNIRSIVVKCHIGVHGIFSGVGAEIGCLPGRLIGFEKGPEVPCPNIHGVFLVVSGNKIDVPWRFLKGRSSDHQGEGFINHILPDIHARADIRIGEVLKIRPGQGAPFFRHGNYILQRQCLLRIRCFRWCAVDKAVFVDIQKPGYKRCPLPFCLCPAGELPAVGFIRFIFLCCQLRQIKCLSQLFQCVSI